MVANAIVIVITNQDSTSSRLWTLLVTTALHKPRRCTQIVVDPSSSCCPIQQEVTETLQKAVGEPVERGGKMEAMITDHQ
jgi:hypothetical protein